MKEGVPMDHAASPPSGPHFYDCRKLSGSALKTIALISMIIDHAAFLLLSKTVFGMEPLFTVGSITVTLYWICRKIGRLAFPLYAFLLSEGYIHSNNRFRYARDLLIFAVLSEMPWNLAHSNGIFLVSSQNVFFTLFLGLITIFLADRYRDGRSLKHIILLIAVFAVSYFFNADYGIRGVGLILLIYLLRNHRIEQALIGSSMFVNNAPVIFLSFLLINTYDGTRGFIRTKTLKYLYYAIYPLHILLFWYLRKHM